MVLTLVSLAVYISSGRLAMKALSNAQPEIAELVVFARTARGLDRGYSR
jgi:hypothetical protein